MQSRLTEVQLAERAKLAWKNFEKDCASMWTPMARGLTGIRDLTVKPTANTPCTDGNTIYLRPPIELAEKVQHSRQFCYKYDERWQPLCSGCETEEQTLWVIFHEMSHIINDSFMAVDERDMIEAIKLSVQQSARAGSSTPAQEYRAKVLTARLKAAYTGKKASYIGVASLISPFLPVITNAWEDVRVNRLMVIARPGLWPMMMGSTLKIFEAGVCDVTGEFHQWRDQPLNYQAAVGLFCKGSEFNYSGWFKPEIEEMLNSPEAQALCDELDQHVKNTKDVYALAYKTLEMLQDKGFCKSAADPEPLSEAEKRAKREQQEKLAQQKKEQEAQEQATQEAAESAESSEQQESSESPGSQESEQTGEESQPGESGESGESEQAGGESDEGDDASADSGDDASSLGGSDTSEQDGGSDTSEQDGGSDSATEDDADGTDESDDYEFDDDYESESGDGSDESGSGDGGEDDGEDADAEGYTDNGELEVTSTTENDLDSKEHTEPAEPQEESAEPQEDMGSADGAGDALKVFGGHAPNTATREEDYDPMQRVKDRAMERAAIQGDFDTPSLTLRGLTVHKSRDIGRRMALDTEVIKVPETILAPALQRMRIAFGDNAKGRMQTNLKAGKINARVLGRRVPVQDPRLFQKKSQPGKRDYLVILGLDMSGSTDINLPGDEGCGYWEYDENNVPTKFIEDRKRIHLIKEAAFAQAELLHRMGVKFAVYAHTGSRLANEYQTTGVDIFEIKSPEQMWDADARRRLSSIQPDECNLDGHTMEFYRKLLDNSTATDKVLMYYTDGAMPSANREEETVILCRELEIMRQKKYTVVGVGVLTDSPREHGLDTIQINELADVHKVVDGLKGRILDKLKRAVA